MINPARLARNMAPYLPHVPKIFWKRHVRPLYMVFFITHRCVAHCGHCFDWPWRQRLRRQDELTLEEYDRFLSGLGRLMFAFITGGEPFIRRDVADIIDLLVLHNQPVKIQIPSNGWFTDRTVETLERVTSRHPRMHASVTLSFDGVGPDHDRVRGLPGLFDRVCATFRALRELEAVRPNFNVNAEITVSALNQDHLLEVYRFLRDELGVRNVLLPLVRGEPRNPEALAVELARYVEVAGAIQRDLEARPDLGYQNFAMAELASAKDVLARQVVARVRREQRQVVTCYAGTLSGVMRSDGGVYPCEMLPQAMGHARQADYDFSRVWFSPRAESIRSGIRRHNCFCTHECPLSVNLLFNPRHLARIMAIHLRRDHARISDAL